MGHFNFEPSVLDSKNAWKDYRRMYSGGFGWRGSVPYSELRYIALHHTASSKTGNAKKDVDRVSREHITNRNWGGIGYHIIITSEEVNGYAVTCYTGDIGTIRAHATNSKGKFGIPVNKGNNFLIGICMVGNFVTEMPSDAQIRSAHEVIKELIFNQSSLTQFKDWNNLKGHSDFDYTACPGQLSQIRSKIMNPPVQETLSGYEKELQDAMGWNEAINRKYGFRLMNKVDKENITREELLIVLHRYTEYLQKSPNV